MIDWELIARARQIPADEESLRVQIAVLQHLESALAQWKAKLPLDLEPVPVFAPILSHREETE
jgi:hypothetical protein